MRPERAYRASVEWYNYLLVYLSIIDMASNMHELRRRAVATLRHSINVNNRLVALLRFIGCLSLNGLISPFLYDKLRLSANLMQRINGS